MKDFVKLILSGLALVVGLVVLTGVVVLLKERLLPGTPEQGARAHPATATQGAAASPSHLTLGGGYKGAKWGMSKDQVKRVLTGTIKDEGDDYVTIGLDGGKEVECWFWNGRLRKVRYLPKLQDGDAAGYGAIVQLLMEKFGNTKASPGYVNSAGIPLDVFEWKDGQTTISFEMMSRALAEKHEMELPTSTVVIVYSSDNLEAEKKSSEERVERNEAEKAINKKKAAVLQDL